jgi:hypothetical protein
MSHRRVSQGSTEHAGERPAERFDHLRALVNEGRLLSFWHCERCELESESHLDPPSQGYSMPGDGARLTVDPVGSMWSRTWNIQPILFDETLVGLAEEARALAHEA